MSFSRRNNYYAALAEITIREDAPEALRVTALEKARELGWSPSSLRDVVCKELRVRPERGNWSDYPNIWDEVQYLVYDCEWFKVYDIIEALYRRMLEQPRSRMPADEAPEFAKEINLCFVDEGIGWQLVDGVIVTRGDDAFERSVHVAQAELAEASRPTAADRITKAVQYLSTRPKPDTSGAISHATGAMECLLHDVTGEALTLGEYLKRYPDLFPGSMRKALDGLWGFASNEGARHGREGLEPSRDDAEFVVAIAAALTAYLNRKHPRI